MLVSILKIIGIIILCILAFLLFLILLVLFAPVRYNISAEYDKNKDVLNARVKVSWLLFINLLVKYSEKKLTYKLKVFFINIINSEKEKRTKKQKQSEKQEVSKQEISKQEISKQEISKQEQSLVPAEETSREADDKGASFDEAKEADNKGASFGEAKEADYKDTPLNKDEAEKKKKFKFSLLHPAEIFDIIINKILDFIESIRIKISELLKNIHKICRIIQAEENRELLIFLVGEARKVFKAILPKKHDIYLKLGFSDPSLTGEVLGAYSVLRTVFNLNFVLEPDFNEEVIEAKVNLKGSIRMISLLVVVIRVYCNKTFRRLIGRK